jgi:hypothetical protein
MQSIHNVQVESGTRISLFVEDSVINKLINGWKTEYGDVLDLGGHTYDVSCHQIESLCHADPKELRKKFPALTIAEARLIAEQSHEYATQDYF